MHYSRQIPLLVKDLEEGKLLLYPTETIWGIGCDATNDKAVQKINLLKKRVLDKSFILLVNDMEMLSRYVQYIPPKARNLIAYHTRPLTIVYDTPLHLPKAVLAEDGSVGIRVTLDPFCKDLIQQFDKPIVSTSANLSGQPFPTSFTDIDPQIIRGVHRVAEYRQSEIAKQTPSVIVKVVDGEDLIFLRK